MSESDLRDFIIRAQQKSGEGQKSMVPAGREKDFPNIVFNE